MFNSISWNSWIQKFQTKPHPHTITNSKPSFTHRKIAVAKNFLQHGLTLLLFQICDNNFECNYLSRVFNGHENTNLLGFRVEKSENFGEICFARGKSLCMRAKSFSAVVEIYEFGILFQRIYVHGRL